ARNLERCTGVTPWKERRFSGAGHWQSPDAGVGFRRSELAGCNTATNCKHSWFRVLRARACFLRGFLQGVGYGDADGKQERVRPGPDGRGERDALGPCSLVGVGTAAQGEERDSGQARRRAPGADSPLRRLANRQETACPGQCAARADGRQEGLVKNRGAGTQGRKGLPSSSRP